MLIIFLITQFCSKSFRHMGAPAQTTTQGYQTMRLVHVDTPARSSSESAHEMQTFLCKILEKKKPTPDDTPHS